MFKQLKNNFTQAFGSTLVWIIILVTIFIKPQAISLTYLWSLIAIATIVSIVFGVLYTYLWNYSTYKATTNIIITSVLNFIAGMASLYLFSSDMFFWILPYAPFIVIITLIGHIIGFYLYSKVEKKKSAKQLNDLLLNK